MTPIRLVLATLVLLSVPGCRAPAPAPERSVLAGGTARNLLVLPLNLAAPMPKELAALSPAVWRELELYLRAQQMQLKTVGLEDAQRLWVSSVREARTAEGSDDVGYAAAARVLVGKLARHADFDAVIAPSLFVRQARIDDRLATWDGVEREVEVEVSREAKRSMEVGTKLEGVAPAASLHVVVLDARGNEIQERIAGLELLVLVRVRQTRSGLPEFAFATRADLFSDPAPVRDGIATALAPFIPLVPQSTHEPRAALW